MSAGQKELFELATRYYRVAHDAIRRYDKHHLILGDRYEGRGRMAQEVLQAAKPFVDVLSFQYFGTPEHIQRDLTHWSEAIGMPTLLADSAKHTRPDPESRLRSHDTEVYGEIMQAVQAMPHCIGLHFCGAYQQNRIRYTGLLRADETPDEAVVAGVRGVNARARAWVAAQLKDSD